MSNEFTTGQTAQQGQRQTGIGLLAYLLLGIGFGIVLTKSEVVSWFRIQEMFRFQSPRMFEIIASAVAVAPQRRRKGEPVPRSVNVRLMQ
jgi:hypothetical protein